MSLRPSAFVVTVVMFVNLAAIMCGLQIGGINGILEMDSFKNTFSYLYQDGTDYQSSLINGSSNGAGRNRTFNLGCSAGNGADSDSLIGIVVSSSNLGSVLGSLVAGWLSDQFSRKYSLAIGGVVIAIGSVVMAASYYVWMLIVGRTLTGIAIGIFYMVMSVYIAEVSPKESRGMLGSTIGPTFMAGVTVALLANIGFAKFSVGWRLANVVLGIVGVIYAIGMTFLPYTPRWLLKEGRSNQALEVLMKINHHSNKETCVDTYMELEQLREATKTDSSSKWRGKLKEVFEKKYRLLVCCTIFFMEAAVALMIYTYSTTIFCEANINGFYASLVVGLVSVAGATISIGLVDRVGRKAILLTGVGTNFVSGLAITILIHAYASPSEVVKYIIVILICIYAFAISFSWLTIPWIVNSEIFPMNIRGTVVSISTSQYWFSAFIIIQLLPLIVGSPLQLHGLFYIVSAINLIAFIFVLFVLPETKGVSLEQMDELFTQSIWQRFVGTFKCSSLDQQEKQVSDYQGKTVSYEEKKQALS